jgi:hypothetical protein
MFNKITPWAFFILLASFLSNGCATAFKGYEDEVELIMADDSLQVYTIDGAEVEIKTEQKKFVFFDKQNKESIIDTKTYYYINLRSAHSHTLVLKKGDRKKIIEVYPKLGGWWFIADILTGTFFIDLYTGNWNFFDNITVEF